MTVRTAAGVVFALIAVGSMVMFFKDYDETRARNAAFWNAIACHQRPWLYIEHGC